MSLAPGADASVRTTRVLTLRFTATAVGEVAVPATVTVNALSAGTESRFSPSLNVIVSDVPLTDIPTGYGPSVSGDMAPFTL